MCDTTPFKTPHTYKTRNNKGFYNTPQRTNRSDSEESTTSNSDAPGTVSSGSSSDLTIVAVFDDLLRLLKQKRSHKVENYLITIMGYLSSVSNQWQMAVQECRRLQHNLDMKTHEYSDLENKLGIARKLLDQEKRNTRQAEKERDSLEIQLAHIRELLFKDKGSTKIPAETREKLAFLNTHSVWEGNNVLGGGQLSAIQEINSTGSLLSDISYSRSEDDLDSSKAYHSPKGWKKHRPSTDGVPEPAMKKRRSSGAKVVEINTTDTVRATTTLTVTKEGPITATSIIESVPKPGLRETGPSSSNDCLGSIPSAPPANLVFESWARGTPQKEKNNNLRPHSFQPKTIVMPDTCGSCSKRVRFGKTCLKCKDCKAIVHNECKDKLVLPCVPQVHTPNQHNILGIISDYTPTIAPMVPALIVHCVNEIELRGLREVGVYRVPGAERDVKSLKEKFLHGRGVPSLNQLDIHVICGCVKDFLRHLNEPIVTRTLWKDFVQAVEVKDSIDTEPLLYEALSRLPQPNRDTLAYMMLHLQRISEAKECKMPITNLAKIFGPTIVGYSSEDPPCVLTETRQGVQVTEKLLQLPAQYWEQFVNVYHPPPSRLQQTPSTDSLLQIGSRGGIFTPSRTASVMKRKQKFFGTPPYFNK